MEYIFHNWADLNLIDRAWFVGGAWLLLLFTSMIIFRVCRNLFGKSHRHSN